MFSGVFSTINMPQKADPIAAILISSRNPEAEQPKLPVIQFVHVGLGQHRFPGLRRGKQFDEIGCEVRCLGLGDGGDQES